GARGGGVLAAVGGSIALEACLFSANTTIFYGGGVFVRAATATLTNCTITGGTADKGGGVFVGTNTSLTLTNSTLSLNTATGGAGGGVAIENAATLTNTLCSRKKPRPIHRPLQSPKANNLVGDGSGMSGISDGSQGNQVGTDQAPINPLLARLSSYGGPTLTMALLPGSLAIESGTATGAPSTDQRGQPRSGHVDIGAF